MCVHHIANMGNRWCQGRKRHRNRRRPVEKGYGLHATLTYDRKLHMELHGVFGAAVFIRVPPFISMPVKLSSTKLKAGGGRGGWGSAKQAEAASCDC